MTNYDVRLNHLRLGGYGAVVEIRNKKAVRISTGINTLPACALYGNGQFVREENLFSETINFLLD